MGDQNKTKCTLCNRTFVHKTSMYRHRKVCQAQGGGDHTVVNDHSNTVVNDHSIHDHSVHNDNSIHTTVVNNTTVVVVPFGDEDLEFLFDDSKRRVMTRCVADPMQGVQQIILLTHFNPRLPEFQNVCIPNISRTDALCFDGRKWIVQDRNVVLKKLVDQSCSTLNAFVDSYDLPPRVLSKYEAFDEKRDRDDPILNDKLRREAVRTIVNNQDQTGVRENARRQRRTSRSSPPSTVTNASRRSLQKI